MSKLIGMLDIETTGFLDDGGKIVEVGICELNLDTGEVNKVFDSVCHEKGITLLEAENSWIVKNSTLDVELIRHSPSLTSLKYEIQNHIDSYDLGITAFNNEFDFGFMEDRGFVFNKKLDCPMKLSIGVLKMEPTARMKKYRPEIKYKTPNVQQAWDYFFPDSDYIEQHRGYDDAAHEAKIVYELYKLGIFKVD